jgi:hypothetical protein
MPMAVYTQDLLAAGRDGDNRAAVRVVQSSQLTLAGLAVYGPRNGVDKSLKGATLNP